MKKGMLRRAIVSSVIWCAFLLLYLAVAGVIALGVLLTAEAWWSKFQHHSSAGVMAYQSARVILLTVAFTFVVVQPFFQFLSGRRRSRNWRGERRSELKED